MNYEITVNQLDKGDGNIRAFASVVFDESFKVSNIAVIENKNSQSFVSMPRYASSKDDSGYKDICHPITKEFREQLYGAVRKSFEESKEKQKSGEGKEQTKPSAGHDGWQEARDTPFR